VVGGGEVVGGEVVGDGVSRVQRPHIALHVLATLISSQESKAMSSAQVINPIVEFLKIETAESTQVEQVPHVSGQCVLASSFVQCARLHALFIIVVPSVVLNL